MLTQQHVDIIIQGLAALKQINNRAKNNSRAPEFIPIYDKILLDIGETETIVRKLAPATKTK